MPTVSFVVTVYNKAESLPGVLDAVAGQRGAFARHCVFVDDGSTDDSLAVLRRRTSGWENTVVATQKNAGPSAASNAALRLARGEFVKFVDGDDILAPHATQHLLDLLTRHGADLAHGAGGHYDLGAPPPAPPAPVDAGTPDADPLALMLTAPPFNLSQVMIRRSLADAVGGFDERIFLQDYPFCLKAALRHRFVGTREIVCFYPRQGGNRLTDDHESMLFHANLSVLLLLAEHDLPADKLRLAARRACGRAWLYAKRHRGRGVLSADYARFALSRLPPAIRQARARRLVRASLASFPGAVGRYRALLESLDG